MAKTTATAAGDPYIIAIDTSERDARETAADERARGSRVRVHKRRVKAGGAIIDVWAVVVVGERR
jgi:hypothetical protein